MMFLVGARKGANLYNTHPYAKPCVWLRQVLYAKPFKPKLVQLLSCEATCSTTVVLCSIVFAVVMEIDILAIHIYCVNYMLNVCT